MRRNTIAIVLATLAVTPAVALTPPSGWSENEWRQFFAAAAAGDVVDGPSADRANEQRRVCAPMMEVYAAFNRMPDSAKPALVTWLGNQRAQANYAGQADLEELYQEYAIAIATGDSKRIRNVLSKSYRKPILEGMAMIPVTTVSLGPAGVGRIQFAKMDTPSFDGVWKTSWGEMQIAVDEQGTAVGRYTYRADRGSKVIGTLIGQVSGHVLRVSRWTEIIPRVKKASGEAIWTLSDNGTHFEGPWRTTVGSTYVRSGVWKADRKK